MLIKNVQALRAIAANGVLLAHLYVVEQKYGENPLLSANAQFGAYGVDLFFVISGFIMATLLKNTTWKKFLLDRVSRIFPPYWFYTTLVLITATIAPSIVNSSFEHQPSLIRSYLLLPDTTLPLLAVGWSLVHEMYFYVCFTFIIVVMTTFRVRLSVCLLLWAMLVVVFNMTLDNPHQPDAPITALIFSRLTLEFIFGAVVGCLIEKGVKKFAALTTTIGAGLLILNALTSSNIHAEAHVRSWQNTLLIGVAFALIVYGLVAFELNNKFIAPEWLTKIGNASYSTYLSHVLVVSALGRVYKIFPFHMEVLFVLACILVSNGMGLISHHLIELPTQKGLRSLFQRYGWYKPALNR